MKQKQKQKPKSSPVCFDLRYLSSDIQLSSPTQRLGRIPEASDPSVKARRCLQALIQARPSDSALVATSDSQASVSPTLMKARSSSLSKNVAGGKRGVGNSSDTLPGQVSVDVLRTKSQYPNDLGSSLDRSEKKPRLMTREELPSDRPSKMEALPDTQKYGLSRIDDEPERTQSLAARSSEDLVRNSLDTVANVVMRLGQSLAAKQLALEAAEERFNRDDKKLAELRQLQSTKDVRIAQLERELEAERAKCLLLEDAQEKLEQIQALCGGLVVAGRPSVKREMRIWKD